RGLDLIDEFAIGRRHDVRLAVRLAQLKNVNVQRNVAVGDVQDEISEAGLSPVIVEAEPLEAFEQRSIGVFRRCRRVWTLVAAAVNRLAKFKGLRRLPD